MKNTRRTSFSSLIVEFYECTNLVNVCKADTGLHANKLKATAGKNAHKQVRHYQSRMWDTRETGLSLQKRHGWIFDCPVMLKASFSTFFFIPSAQQWESEDAQKLILNVSIYLKDFIFAPSAHGSCSCWTKISTFQRASTCSEWREHYLLLLMLPTLLITFFCLHRFHNSSLFLTGYMFLFLRNIVDRLTVFLLSNWADVTKK